MSRMNVYDVLKERGFIYQTTDDAALRQLLSENKVTCYIGFDATADSLHVGSLIPIMGLVHMQAHGHCAIALLGGGTTLVGDPSGKTEMRKMLAPEMIEENISGIRRQLEHYLSFDGTRGLLLNNAEWLVQLKYIDFLRDIGAYFSVNRMLTAESYKARLETGLSFIEFNYMLLQSYDFYTLAERYGCRLQMGGQDQWGNIVSGSDLTRRMLGIQVYGLTFPLLKKSTGEKFGKTESGTIWLDSRKTPVMEFYQYWRNADDADVENCLAKLTLLPMEEVRRLPNENVNRAKEILAYEVTKMAHGKEAALKAYAAAVRQFGSSDPSCAVRTSSDIGESGSEGEGSYAQLKYPRSRIKEGLGLVTLLSETSLCKGKSDARRLIQQGGAYLNQNRITDTERFILESDLTDGILTLQAGKKRHVRILFE